MPNRSEINEASGITKQRFYRYENYRDKYISNLLSKKPSKALQSI